MTSSHSSPWICCQLGAREHYAIPRALHQTGQLAHLITDAWVTPQSLLNRIPSGSLQSLYDRYHPDLAQASVQSFTPSLLQFELLHKFWKTDTWPQIMARNDWFQRQAIQRLQTLERRGQLTTAPPILFTYSYAALDLLKYAKQQGWYTVLGQIDPGPVEEDIVIAEHRKYPQLAPAWQPVPPSYWETWQEECELADRILINSTWSKQALQQAGIASGKLEVIPLAYQPPEAAQAFQRDYPNCFSTQRPLRVLFLGQIILRKGIAAILEAARLLQDQPIEFWMVGPIGIDLSQVMLPNVRWIGPAPRSQVAQYYQQADVFLLPTLSDGFGLTQLEAQAWKLPLIVSRFCGEVVKDGVDGVILPEVSGEAIVQPLRVWLQQPQNLAKLTTSTSPFSSFDLSHLYRCLARLSEKNPV